ncbi:MAG TPA: MFS transporter, partial [bacterium]
SAGMLAIGYAYTFVAPLLGGAAWDYTHAPAASFFPAACGALTVLAAASGLAAPRRAADPA